MKTRCLALLVLLLAGCQPSPRVVHLVETREDDLVLDYVVEHELSRNCFGNITLDRSGTSAEP